ncbi:MAG TPA: serine hydrolase domain-containing protein [Gemmatimonadales bacterium]|jgi:CubicO group peptidase (beta-lactamase class C family)|nr:serine hydrolase domain-containing protein [Gemmatimonadales bacterium]
MIRDRGFARLTALLSLVIVLAAPVAAQQLTPVERARIDSAAVAVLGGTGAPSASVAVVRGGEIVYEHAYGEGRIGTPATPAMRYAIGSVSKQFTVTAILLLAEEGKLSLDDKVARWFPALTRADQVTLRQLLSMTSGYQDYWPQDYVFTAMQVPTTADAIMQQWAKQALDFDPGTAWQYSNTNYVIAGAIVEKVAGMPFMQFLRQRIFSKLGMTSVADFDAGPLGPADAGAYLRNGLGPLRDAPKEGPHWLFAAGQLAMTSHDLATWDLGMINQAILKPESYRAQQTTTLLANGTSTGYGLGINVGIAGGRKRLSHGGAVSGYTTTNQVYPDDKAAIVVFTNIYPGGAGASGQIASRIAAIIFAPADTTDNAAGAMARRVYDGLARGTIDKSLLTSNAEAFFTAQVLADYASSLGPLGAPTAFTPTGSELRGGLRITSFRIRAGAVVMDLTMMTRPDGRIEQYIVARAG